MCNKSPVRRDRLNATDSLLYLCMFKTGYQIQDQNAIHFVTFSVVEWIDVFTRKFCADIVVDSLKHCQQHKGLNVHAWCIMSDHAHLILSANEPNHLSAIIRDLKKFTSYNIIRAIEENNQESRCNWMLWIFKSAGQKNKRNDIYQFRQQDNHPIECSTNEILESRMEYLHQNPVKAGIVFKPEDYVYSSAIDYYTDEKGLIPIDFL